MGYLADMVMLVPFLAAAVAGAGVPASPAVRFDAAASAEFIVRARIIHSAAGVGHGRPPPIPHMKPRRAKVSAADGRAVLALVYDFE